MDVVWDGPHQVVLCILTISPSVVVQADRYTSVWFCLIQISLSFMEDFFLTR